MSYQHDYSDIHQINTKWSTLLSYRKNPEMKYKLEHPENLMVFRDFY